jgi:hypothetical protein
MPRPNLNPQTGVSSRPERSAVEGPGVRLSAFPNSPSKPQPPNRSVIPTGAKRSGGTCCAPVGVPEFSAKPQPPNRCVIPTERTRISCHAALDKTTCAHFRKEGRMRCTNATKIHRKSGVAQWRDLPFLIRRIGSEWKRKPTLCHPERSRGICSSADPSWKCFSTGVA